ncbi:hypothetical protein, partial [Cysteiniphilum sp. 19S12-1]|uniref:hypothetical protein n=1 Tax=Cysteiniphilum sp. 19S12-1 TaxID=3453130 RepID=UPI003F82EBD4
SISVKAKNNSSYACILVKQNNKHELLCQNYPASDQSYYDFKSQHYTFSFGIGFMHDNDYTLYTSKKAQGASRGCNYVVTINQDVTPTSVEINNNGQANCKVIKNI